MIIKIIFVIKLSLIVFISNSQIINNRYSFTNSTFSTGLNVLENDSGYLFMGGSNIGIASIGIVQTDVEGNVLFKKTLMDTNIAYFAGFQGSLIKVSSGGYAMYGGKIVGGTISFSLLYRFNNIGDTLWTKTLGDSTFFQAGSQVKETLDGGFICIAQNTKNSGQNWLVKTDSLGNIAWENWYGTGLERPTAIAVCTDSGYICTGWTNSLGVGTPTKTNIRITKLDKLGNAQWTKIFGQADDDNAWSIAQTQDGGYIFGGSIRTVNTDSRTKPYAIRLNDQGDTVWTRAYNPPTLANSGLTGFRTIIELPDGNFIAAGQEVTTDSAITVSRHDGLVMKVKPNGDPLWHKTYRIPWMSSNNQTSFEIKDIRPTSDGGFICGGVVYPSSPDTGTQDMWLMKIDSNGCVDTSNCVIVSIDETSNHKLQTLSVYPNPNNGLFTLELPTPMAIGVNTPTMLTLYDYTGKQILQQPITQPATKIDVTRYPKGIYFYRVETEKELFIGKVVAQ
ncbi:MAG: T9SS type A sorting domain-containing protein [Vicingaceae bacterium]|nr:T9SS type A sorting domain-containing protein [Vicingaceae bacterium]